jgi:hypothetical protein
MRTLPGMVEGGGGQPFVSGKPTLADRINKAIATNDTKTGRIPMGKGPVETPARTYLSPTDSYEDEIGFDSGMETFSPGAIRGMWAVADQQQASVPTTALRVGNTQSIRTTAVIGGIQQNPQAPANQWAHVPQMILNLPVKGPVLIHANVTVRSSVASDVIAFGIYRDGQPVGNFLTHTTPATASAVSLVQLSAMDNPPQGNHLYALYWSPGTGTLVANSNQRNLYAVNLSPQ